MDCPECQETGRSVRMQKNSHNVKMIELICPHCGYSLEVAPRLLGRMDY